MADSKDKGDGKAKANREGTGNSAGGSSARAGESKIRGEQRLLSTLEQLLAIESTNLRSALDQAADLLAEAIDAEKVDAFLYDPIQETLVALGTSNTPMGRRQRQIGLDRLPIANDGVEAAVFHTGEAYLTGHAEDDPRIPVGLTRGLGVNSTIIAPLVVNGERRGVMQACSTRYDAFSQDDLSFLEAVGHWVGTVAHRAELVERIAQDAAAQAKQVAADELVTVLAHDLRNYITPLRGRLDLILRRARRKGDESGIEDAEAATLALDRLQAIITDLMDVGRLEQGIFALSPQPVDLVDLIKETTGVMQTKQLKIIVRTPDEMKVDADPARIRQALENLVANALKHSPRGVPITVELRSEMRSDDGPGDSDESGASDVSAVLEENREWAVVTVQDEGAGIPAELIPRLFTRFATGPGSTGLGLGLFLARSIAEAHGGTLTVESEPGSGTRFYLSLPCL